MSYKYVIGIFILTLFFFTLGCNTNRQSQEEKIDEPSQIQLSTQEDNKQLIANHLEEELLAHKEVTNIIVVNDDKNIVVGVEVYHNDRFKLKDIEKKIKEEVERTYPEHKVTVSIDKKIVMELEKLDKKLMDENIEKEKIKKDIEKIISLSEDKA